MIDPNIKLNISSDSLNTYVDVAIKCLHNQPKLRPTMAEVVVSLQFALTLQEKSTFYSLVEIMPDDLTQEDLDPPIFGVKDTIHKREHKYTRDEIVEVTKYTRHEIVKVTKDRRRNKQSSAGMTFTERFGALLSVTSRAFSVHESVPLTPWGQEETLQSSKLKSFELSDLRKATRNFHSGCVLGEGGFGSVFKGWIDENTFASSKWGTGLITVKRLNLDGSQGHLEWLANINNLGRVSHPNLVKLIGYCLKEEHRLLVYEFVPRGSLEKHLFRTNSYFEPLSWNVRIRIALGAAKGLAYLHSSLAGVIYRDFKTANILIDSNYNAKLSNFGIAKDGSDFGITNVSTMMMGTYGYAAPEYMSTGRLNYKSDIYGFGVVLLEILTGRRVIDKKRPPGEHYLIDWAKPYLTSKQKALHVMDADITGQYTVRAALSASSLALKCISVAPKSRPDTNQVVKELEQLQNM